MPGPALQAGRITDHATLAGRFQVMLLEGLDRLSRDQVEQETIIRRLEHRGIRILGCSDGYDSTASGRKLHRSMRGHVHG